MKIPLAIHKDQSGRVNIDVVVLFTFARMDLFPCRFLILPGPRENTERREEDRGMLEQKLHAGLGRGESSKDVEEKCFQSPWSSGPPGL